ncbi:hypothetical protein AB0N17_44795 [Streptomyces sp. NPDC051133]|uniref:hypothetical protein n=1 Tax=Streptomyces sp. NPDC051133 TaxID=3155521 RepID=UPI003442E5BF
MDTRLGRWSHTTQLLTCALKLAADALHGPSADGAPPLLETPWAVSALVESIYNEGGDTPAPRLDSVRVAALLRPESMGRDVRSAGTDTYAAMAAVRTERPTHAECDKLITDLARCLGSRDGDQAALSMLAHTSPRLVTYAVTLLAAKLLWEGPVAYGVPGCLPATTPTLAALIAQALCADEHVTHRPWGSSETAETMALLDDLWTDPTRCAVLVATIKTMLKGCAALHEQEVRVDALQTLAFIASAVCHAVVDKQHKDAVAQTPQLRVPDHEITEWMTRRPLTTRTLHDAFTTMTTQPELLYGWYVLTAGQTTSSEDRVARSLLACSCVIDWTEESGRQWTETATRSGLSFDGLQVSYQLCGQAALSLQNSLDHHYPPVPAYGSLWTRDVSPTVTAVLMLGTGIGSYGAWGNTHRRTLEEWTTYNELLGVTWLIANCTDIFLDAAYGDAGNWLAWVDNRKGLALTAFFRKYVTALHSASLAPTWPLSAGVLYTASSRRHHIWHSANNVDGPALGMQICDETRNAARELIAQARTPAGTLDALSAWLNGRAAVLAQVFGPCRDTDTTGQCDCARSAVQIAEEIDQYFRTNVRAPYDPTTVRDLEASGAATLTHMTQAVVCGCGIGAAAVADALELWWRPDGGVMTQIGLYLTARYNAFPHHPPQNGTTARTP